MKIYAVVKNEYEWLGGSHFNDTVVDYYATKVAANSAAELLNNKEETETEYYSCTYCVKEVNVKEG